jgi:predicted ATPase
MLTRLRVQGFKNLQDVDLHFGHFTCIAGPNEVEKSNLFDAITLLSDLAHKPLIEALLAVRGTNGRISEIERLFGPPTEQNLPRRMQLVVEMIVPKETRDDYDRTTKPTATFLEYTLEPSIDPHKSNASGHDLVYIEREELEAKSSSEAQRWLPFLPKQAWIKKHVVGPGPRTAPSIKTEVTESSAESTIKLPGDRSRGRPFGVPARKSPQTVISGVNAASHPTALAARNEMRSWRLLQLEPGALRRPDELHGPSAVSPIGEHLPAALQRIGSHAEIAARLSELVPGVVSVDIDADKVRQTLTLEVALRDKRSYSASSLSDGTLRFLALAILASDPASSGLICMEEPENGIHPLRIPAMLRPVRALADEDSVSDSIGPQGLRQVMIDTHSPQVVAGLPDDAHLVAESLRLRGVEFASFKPLPETWRTRLIDLGPGGVVSRGDLNGYLGNSSIGESRRRDSTRRTVADRFTPDLFAAT